ncbi:MAG: hypothetical protein AAB756_01445 [Patescibacteria group bacterium]
MDTTPDEKDPIDKLSERLYRNDGMKTRHRTGMLHRASYDANKGWANEYVEKESKVARPTSSLFKKIFIGSVLFFVVSFGFAFYMFYGGGNVVSNEKIDLSIFGPAFTEGGNEFELEFDVKNGNSQALQYADLVIEYPKGATLEGDKNTVRVRKFLGELPAGESRAERAKIVLFGEEGSERTVKAILEYRVSGSNAIFVKEAGYLVHIKSSPLSLSVNSLKETNSNQDFVLNIETLANADKTIRNILLKVEYPAGFVFRNASIPSSYGNNTWRLGDLDKGKNKTIAIHGIMQGEDGEERSFRIYVGTENEKDTGEIGVIYSSFLQTIAIKRPFLETKLLVDGVLGTEYVVGSTAPIAGEVNWINNLPNRVLDAEIYVRIIGDILDKSSVVAPAGFFGSSDNTITWNKDTSSELAQLEGGDSGKFPFTFKVLPLFSGNRTLFRNPMITIEVGVRGRRLLETNVPEQISASEKKIIKISSNAQLSVRAFYYSGPFKNTGGIPPRADRETSYAIVWTVLNSSNDLSKAQVKTKLPTYARWLDSVSPQGEDVTFNPETREVTWDLRRVDAGVGIETALRQTAFQVGFTPSISQVGKQAELTGEALFSGVDSFTNAEINFTRSAPTTNLINETNIKIGDDIIVK